MHIRQSIVVVAALAVLASAGRAAPPQPVAARRPVTDTYWGVSVVDDYQYLEDVADAEVVAWAEAENACTRDWLDGQPFRQAILDRVVALTHSDSPRYGGLKFSGGRLFAVKHQPPMEQDFLVAFPHGDSLTGEQILLDPNAVDSTGRTSIDFYVPSLDGSLVAVSLSEGGTEDGTLYVYDVETGQARPDVIPRVNGGTAGGSVTWTAGGEGFFYTRYPAPGERPEEDLPFYQHIYYHALGTPVSQDSYALGDTFPRIAEIELETSPDGRTILAQVSNGDGGEYEYWLGGTQREWAKFADFDDRIIGARFGGDGAVYLLSRDGAPRNKVLRLPLETPDLPAAQVVVPEGDGVIRGYCAADTALYVVEMQGGPSRLKIYPLGGGPATVADTGEASTISSLVALDADEVLFQQQGYRTPPAFFRLRPGAPSPEPTPLAHTSPADFSDCSVVREFAPAEDGTLIPVTIVVPAGRVRDGSAPLLLYGYGSYGMTMTPYFSAHRRIWLEQGGIYAVANIRGGGAYGDRWHRQARLEHKKVTMDDFAACARHLVARRYTTADHLAIQGGSAGGLMVLGVMVHHPDVAGAVVAHVGIADALRTELSPNGEFNITEFGTVRDRTQFEGMYAYSPYHNVKDGTVYPALLATTGMNDPRVEPWQSFKMVARLQASGTPNPVLLRVSHNTGHGGGTALSERDQQLADTYTFLFAALGLEYTPIGE